MSWDSYIDNLIGHAKGEHIDRAVVFGQDGSPWTTSAHANSIKHTGTELKTIADEMMRGTGNGFGATGIKLEGLKYQFLRYDSDLNVAYGKKKGEGSITIQATKTAFILAHCPEGAQQGVCNTAVDCIALHLSSSGY